MPQSVSAAITKRPIETISVIRFSRVVVILHLSLPVIGVRLPLETALAHDVDGAMLNCEGVLFAILGDLEHHER